ncbi:MAG: TonB-dependent receptor, partial [Bacteroidia bacterium]|nr:TonB-dependent receptor [Bacteroidia bacterium]
MKNKNHVKYFAILFFAFINLQLVFSQYGGVKGVVYIKATGESAAFCNVYIKGTTIGTSTDANGYFMLSKIPVGIHTLVITSLEFDTLQDIIQIKDNVVISKKYFGERKSIRLQEVEISANKSDKTEKVNISVTKIDPIVINKLPSIGEPDIAQYLQVLPGVVSTGDQGGQIYIRGGLPVQNKILLDGMTIFNPFHSLGLFSVFDNDIIKQADVYSAGFNVEYGGRNSAIMDIRTKDGNKKNISGKIQASTFSAKLSLEGPIIKQDSNKAGASYVLSFKHSYLPQTSPALYKYANDFTNNKTNGLPYYFTDLFAKTSFNTQSGSKINFFGFNFNDKADFKNIATFTWKSVGGGTNFYIIPPSSNLIMDGFVNYSNYKIKYTNNTISGNIKTSEVGNFDAGFNFVKYIGRNDVRLGIDINVLNTDYEIQNPNFSPIQEQRSTANLGAYAKFRWILLNKHLVIEPGFRAQYYATLGIFSPEPRIGIKYNITNTFRMKAAGGLYSQSLFSANSDRDVVNLFYGYIHGPDSDQFPNTYLDKNKNKKTTTSSVQKAWHAVAGVEYDFLKFFEVNVEGYYKFFNTIINVNRDKLYDDNQINQNIPDIYKKVYIIEQGDAMGLDFTLKYESKKLYLWIVYSYMRTNRWAGNASTGEVIQYPPIFDRRHNVNIVASYNFGNKKQYELNIRWNFGSPYPFTPTQGFYPNIQFNNSINYNYINSNANLGYIPGALNSGRLIDYHRLDIGFRYFYNLSEKTKLELNAGATNVYNRKNVFYVDRFTFDIIYQLPVMPYLTLGLI